MNYLIKDTTLTAIGDAVRAKGNTEDKILVSDLATAISNLPTGGGGTEIPDIIFTVKNICSYRFSYDNMNYFLENDLFKNRWIVETITMANYMFGHCKTLTKIPFSLKMAEGRSTGPTQINYMFYYCESLKELPDLDTPVYADGLSGIIANCGCIREIPQSWYDNLKLDYINNQSYPSCSSIFNNCYSLRRINSDFLKKCKGKEDSTSQSSSVCYGGFQGCFNLDEIVGLPTNGKITSNMFSSTFYYCYHLKNIIFDMNLDGTPKTANWKSQTIDISNNIGYNYEKNYFINRNSGITADKEVKDDATYQALKNDPDWFATIKEYSRYNHDSAVNTINSLPDTSAYLATAGGTNTIKFKGQAGALTDGGAINTLTEEEIAVATAKGWTVSLV